MEFKRYTVKKDLVISGAGIPGICAAIQAARLGLTVALIMCHQPCPLLPCHRSLAISGFKSIVTGKKGIE